jgi:hypothetical protein
MTKNILIGLFMILNCIVYSQQQEVSARKAVPQKTERPKSANNTSAPISNMSVASNPKPVKRPKTLSTEVTPVRKAEK